LLKEWYSTDSLANAKIIHYHDAMWSPYWSQFMHQMNDALPDVAGWLNQLGPTRNIASTPMRALNRALRIQRDARERAYIGGCVFS
jgi:hypothetical protein